MTELHLHSVYDIKWWDAPVLEFDKFLAERAAAGEKLPDQPAGSNNGSQPGTPSRTAGRQLHKDDSDNALFAL